MTIPPKRVPLDTYDQQSYWAAPMYLLHEVRRSLGEGA